MTLNFGNQLFPPRGEVSANFDFIEIATGQGYGNFYLFTANESTPTDTKLITETLLDSNTKSTSTSIPSDQAAAVKNGDYDFDMTVQTPIILRGFAYAELTMKAIGAGVNGNRGGYIIVKLRKYDGSTETDIASAQTDTMDSVDNSTPSYQREAVFLDITSNTSFAIGDKIRITVEVWGISDGDVSGTPGSLTFYHDPTSRDTIDSDKDSDFKIQLPFKINI
jgi:hypothetical protein